MKLIPYTHFAIPNLYLESGYLQENSIYGELTTYCDEDGLEECIRRILIQIPKRLNGYQLRFLRRGLKLTQADFGSLIEKNEQTVARFEKSNKLVSRAIDLTIRTLYFNNKNPSTDIGEILSIVDEKSKFLGENIILSFVENKWIYKHDIPVNYKKMFETETPFEIATQELHKNVLYKMEFPINSTESGIIINEFDNEQATLLNTNTEKWGQTYAYN